MVNGVDALSITWMILTQARWLKLRFKMTMRQLARWCDSFIRSLPKSSARIGPRRTAEEDLCQMIFIKVFQKLSQFSGNVPLEHWVSRVAVNTCLNQIESEKVRPEVRHADLSVEEQAVVENLASSSDELAPDQRFASRQLVEHLLGGAEAGRAAGDRFAILAGTQRGRNTQDHWLERGAR